MDLEYLGRSLNTRSYAAAEAFGVAKATVMANAAAHGALGSGRTLLQFQEKALSIFTEKANEAAQFTYNLTETNDREVVKQLDYCMGRMVEMISSSMAEASNRLGIGGSITVTQANKTKELLVEKKKQLMDDFAHGMMGSQKLKKDPVVRIVSNQTNSPGAIQQVGVGEFSQKAFVQNHQPLVDAVNRALASPEYQKLEPEQKDAFKDVADTLLEEAKKDTPDPGKLKRWGHRLAELGAQLGLHVAATEIVHIVTGMFSGGG